jgi:hypothetical protein
MGWLRDRHPFCWLTWRSTAICSLWCRMSLEERGSSVSELMHQCHLLSKEHLSWSLVQFIRCLSSIMAFIQVLMAGLSCCVGTWGGTSEDKDSGDFAAHTKYHHSILSEQRCRAAEFDFVVSATVGNGVGCPRHTTPASKVWIWNESPSDGLTNFTPECKDCMTFLIALEQSYLICTSNPSLLRARNSSQPWRGQQVLDEHWPKITYWLIPIC